MSNQTAPLPSIQATRKAIMDGIIRDAARR